MGERVTVTARGPVGSGKSAILGEIEITFKALGVSVEYADERAAQSEKHMIGADWQTFLEMYQPTVVLVEEIDHGPAPEPSRSPWYKRLFRSQPPKATR